MAVFWFIISTVLFSIEEIMPMNSNNPDMNGHLAELVYDNAVKTIHDIQFVIDLLKIAQKYKFTKKLQDKIVR